MNEDAATAERWAELTRKIAILQHPVSEAEGLAAIRERVALAAPMTYARIRITGKDAADYLHRRLSQSVKSIKPGSGTHALQLSGEGRMEADLLLYRPEPQEFAVLVEAPFAAKTVELLDKYVLMDDVEIDPSWEAGVSLTLMGPRSSLFIARRFGGLPSEMASRDAWSAFPVSPVHGPAMLFRDGRWRTPCFRVFVAADKLPWLAEYLKEALDEMEGRVVSDAAFEYARIADGVTRFGRDTHERTLPLESNLRSALDLNKGCFPGQEFLARINNLGHPAHVLARLWYDGMAEVASGDAVVEEGSEPDSGGSITSFQSLEGVEEGLALATLPWKMHELRNASIVTKTGRVTAMVELLGEYHDARAEAR